MTMSGSASASIFPSARCDWITESPSTTTISMAARAGSNSGSVIRENFEMLGNLNNHLTPGFRSPSRSDREVPRGRGGSRHRRDSLLFPLSIGWRGGLRGEVRGLHTRVLLGVGLLNLLVSSLAAAPAS